MTNAAKLKVEKQDDLEIVVTRLFNAPRKHVFDAHTKPELLKRWLFGPPDWTLAECEVDLRVAGRYRYLWHGPDGREMEMSGIHREIAAPERLVVTQNFKAEWFNGPGAGNENIGSLLLTERDSKTTLINTTLYQSRAARDGALEGGMSSGMEAGYARLDELLATLHG